MQAMESNRLNQFSLGTEVIESKGKILSICSLCLPSHFHLIFLPISLFLIHIYYFPFLFFPFIHPKNGVYTYH